MASFLAHLSSAFHENSLEQDEIAVTMLDPTINYHAAPAPAAPIPLPADKGFNVVTEVQVSGSKVKVKANCQDADKIHRSVMESTAETQRQRQAAREATVRGSVAALILGGIAGLAVWRMTGHQAPKTVVPLAGKINATRTTVPRHALRAYRAGWNDGNNSKK
ncbi:hypothetical protein OQA88_12631 [Cercophora sp. LCS_1]